MDTSTGENGYGTLTITRFDDQEHIISGTFEFTVQGNNGELIKSPMDALTLIIPIEEIHQKE